MSKDRLPRAQSESLSVRWVDDELVILDEAVNAVHCLTGDAAQVFLGCTGNRTPEQIAHAANLPLDTVEQALSELADAGLLATAPSALDLTRRAFATKTARAAAVAAGAAPLLYSLVLAPASASASPLACDTQVCYGIGATSGAARNSATAYCRGDPQCGPTATCVGTYSAPAETYGGRCFSPPTADHA
jgi:hypothetical protein